MEEPYLMTAADLARAIRERRIGAKELTRMFLDRIGKHDGRDGLNAVAELDEAAISQAKLTDSDNSRRNLPMSGLPVLIKDNIDVRGLHTTAGSLALADNISASDAPVIANLRKNGAIILGKTNMTEFANYTAKGMPAGYSSRGGQVKNAYDQSKTPGGSSSGSAVAMSAGLCAAAVGTDTSFSITACAAENGVTGLKPPHGSLSARGIIPISHTLDSAGPMTRGFSDALLVYSCMRDTPLPAVTPADPGKLRIAVNKNDLSQVSDAQLARYETLFAALRADGVRFTEVTHGYTPCQSEIMRCEFRHDLEEYLSHTAAHNRTLEDIVRFYEADPERMMRYGIAHLREALYNASGKLDDPPYLDALSERRRLRAQLLENLIDFDACVFVYQTNFMHFTGLPSLTLRLGMADDGTPRGIILYGADEFRLYSAALTIEKYCGDITPPKLGHVY